MKFFAIRVGDFSIERDIDPWDEEAPPVVRIVLDYGDVRELLPAALHLRGEQRAIAARMLRALLELEPRGVQLGGLDEDFVAAARRFSADEGAVTLERFDGLGLAEKLEVPLAAAPGVAAAIDFLIALGDRDPATEPPAPRAPQETP